MSLVTRSWMISRRAKRSFQSTWHLRASMSLSRSQKRRRKGEDGPGRMAKDPQFHCGDCHHQFIVRSIVAKYAKDGNRPIACPRCGNKNTDLVGKIVRKRAATADTGPSPMDEPASESPLGS